MSAATFQNPSAQMKRALFQSLAIGAFAVILYMFCIQPCQSALAKAQAEQQSLQGQQDTMSRDIKGANRVKARMAELEAKHKAYSAGLLEPLLESYAMRAKSLLDPLVEGLNMSVNDYAELPTRKLPLPVPMAPQLYARKPIRMTCTGSYMSIVSFILRVEKKLPFAVLEAVVLKVQKDPDTQTAELVFEWPIKGENVAPAAAVNGGAKK